MKNEKSDSLVLKDILNDLERLKIRLEKVEKELKGRTIKKEISKVTPPFEEKDIEIKIPGSSDGSIEFRFGEYGMAWLGNIVLLFGITFLVHYIHNTSGALLAAIVGYAATGIIHYCSRLTKNLYSFLSKLLNYNGHLLLFYFTLRLHFLQEMPLIENKIIGLILLSGVLCYLLFIAYKKQSQLLSGIVLLLILGTGVIYNSTFINAAFTALTALLAVLFYKRFGWIRLVFIFIFLTYLTHTIWLLNNPIMGNPAEFIKSPGMGYFFLIATGFIFSQVALIKKKDTTSDDFIITTVIWNGLGFTLLLIITVITYFSQNFVNIFAVISIFCIIYSIILQSRSSIKIIASIYALYGFLSLSVAFFGLYGLPKAFMLLSLESLLVVSMALWFRSRFIVIMNSILFLILIVFYLIESPSSSITNFSFMLTAFITARIINWEKDRLKIKTEMVRNLYLIEGLVMTLVSCYFIFSKTIISVSWIGAAILFFAMSLLLKNIKYRWLAIATIIVTAFKLIFIDMSKIDIGYRILVFLLLAIISITVSILYTKYYTHKKSEHANQSD